MKTILTIVLFSALCSLNCGVDNDIYNFTERGKASYYSDFFEGKLTASGDVFSQEKMTAAHKSLPFGTEVLVENIHNGRTVTVFINDRGPFVKNRIIDLSKSAAQALGMIEKGVQRVVIRAIIDESSLASE